MARPVSDEELQLKKRARRRLVGAIVLVTAVAVILPMVLDSEPKSSNQNVDIQIPSPDSGEFKPKAAATADKGAKAPAASADASSGKPKSDPIAATGDPPAPKELVKEPPKAPDTAKVVKEPPVAKEPQVAKESAPKEAPAAAPGAYVVQVAALSDASKARQLERQLAGAGVKTYTEVVNTQAGEVTRVRAGPFSTREAAEKARTQLKKAGLDGKIVPK